MDRAALNQSPASPNTPVSANSYQVNVNRTKTRKWVEARVQSYDGDDWGVDDYHDDANDSADESLSHLQQSSMPAHSPETRVYSNPGSAAPVALASARSPSQQYVVGTEPVQPRLDSNSSSPFAPSFSAAANAADNQRDFSPGLGARGLAIIPNSADSEPRGSTAHVDFAASEPGVSAGNPRQEDHAAAAPAAALPPLDRSWKNFEGKSPRGRLEPFPRHRQQAFGDNADRLKDDALQGSTSPGDRRESRRASRSPQLPDMARMSSFGTDLLTAAGFSSPSSPVEASHDGHGTASPTNDDVNASNPQKQSPVPDDSFPSASKTDQLKLTPDSPPSDHDYDIGNHDDHVSKEADQHFESPKLLSNPVAHDDDAKEPLGSIDASSLSSLDSEAKEQLAAANLGHVSDSSQPNHAAVEPLRTLSPAQLAKNASEDVAAHSTADDGNDVKPAANAATDEHFESQPVQRGNTFSTIASSPVKESDVLRDEILRSLSPGGGDRMALPSQDASAVRASSYTLGAYDSYWADTTTETAKAPTELDEAHESGQEEEQEEQGQTNAQASIPDGSEPRRKFSWEADDQKDDSRPGSEIVHVRHSPAHGPPSVSETASSPIRLDTQVNLEGHQGLAESPSLVLNHALTGMEQGDTGNEPAAPAVMANQDRDTALTMAPPQPPSPASLASDGAGAAAVSGSRSLASETTPPQEADSGATAPTPPPDEGHPVAGDWPSTRGSGHQSGLPVMTFREILAVPSSSARVAKFIETRDYFANVQFGLDAWLAALDKQHLDLGVPSAVEYIGPLLSASSHQSLGATPPAIQQSQQQAYPGASNAATSPKGRSRKAGLSISSQSGGGALGHSSNQLGTKSKELMHSAGKMGKGLLSKGKNKLRSSGDKDDIYVMDRVESNDDGQAIISLPGEMNQAPNLCTLATASEAASDLFQPLGQGEAGQEQVVPVQGLGLILYQDDQGANQQLCQHPPSTIYTATSGAGQDEHSPEQQSCAFRLPPIRRSSTINMSSSMGIVKGRKAALKDDGADKSQPASSALETPWDSHAQMAAFDIAPDKAPSSEPIPSTVFPPQGRPRAAGLKRLVKDKQSMPTSRRRLDDEHATQEVLALPVNTVVRARPIVLRGSVPNLAKGPWKLEESHLTKPLQTQTRNRSGTSSSQQPVMTSYEKETGLTTPILAPKPTRPRTSEVLLAVGSDFAEPPSPRMSQDDDFAEPEMTWSGEKRVAGQADDLIQPDELVQKRLEKEQELTSLGDGAFWTAKQANKPCANSPVSQQMENVATANPSMTPRASYHEVQQRAISSSSNSGGSIGHESTSRQGSQKSSPLVSSNARSAAPAPAPEGIANVSRRLDEDAMLPPLNPSLKMEASPKLRGNMSMPGIRDVFRRARHFRHDKSRQLPKGKGKQDAKGATRSPYQSHHADVSAAGQLPSVDVEGYDRRGSTPNILSSLSGTSTSGYGTSDQDGLEGHQQRWLRPQSAGSLPTMLARWSGEHQHGPEAKALHTAPFDEAGVGPSTLGLHRSAAARNPRPSPLGTEEPLTQRNLCPDVIREEPMNDNTAVAHKAKGDHIRHVSEPFPSMAQASHQAVPRTQSLRLAYIGAQHDGEPQRATMSSPHLSVASDRTHGCDLEAGRQDAHAWARPAYGPGGRRYASYQGEPTKRAKPRRRTISHLANTSQSRDEPKEKKKGHHGEGWSKRMSRFELSGLFRGFGKRRISLVEPEVDHGAPQPPAHSFAETPRMNRSLDSVPRPGQVASSGAVKRHSEEHISRWKGLGSRLLGHFSHFASSSQEKVGKHQNNNKSSNKRVEQVAPRTLSGFHGGAVDQRRPHNDDASRRQDGFYARQGRAGHHLQPPTSAAPKHARAVSQSILPTEATGSRSGPFAAPVARTRHSLPLAPMGQSSQAAAAAPRDKRLHAGHVAEFGPVFESVPVPRRYEIVHGEGSLAHAAGGGKVEAACQDEEQATRFGQQDWLRQQQQYQYQHQASQYQKPSVAPQQDSGPMWVQPPLSQPETMTPRTNLLHLADGLPRAGPSSAAAAAGQRPVSHNYHMSKPRSCSYSLADSPGCQSGDESRLSVEAITVSQQSYSPAFDMGQAARRPGAESISRNGSQGSEESKCDTAMPTSAVDTVRCLAQNSSGRDDDDDDDDEHVVGKSPVELDDTADHYQRSRRLEMQEEKILFRPEDSQDWQPPMLATSYPGQEWNPYNE